MVSRLAHQEKTTGNERFSGIKRTLGEGLMVLAASGILSEAACRRSEPQRQDAAVSQRISGAVLESEVIISPAGKEGKLVEVSALAFHLAPGKVNAIPLDNAHFVMEFFQHGTDSTRNEWHVLPGCEDIISNQVRTAYRPGPENGNAVPYEQYYAKCDLTAVKSGFGPMYFRATFVPRSNDNVASSSAEYELR